MSEEATGRLMQYWDQLSGGEQCVVVNVMRQLLEERQVLPVNPDAERIDAATVMPIWNRLDGGQQTQVSDMIVAVAAYG